MAMPNSQYFCGSHARWRAVTQRDPSAHCSFLYGVTSTKIYCRPTCTARVARRANVVFYDTIEQAQRNGFRPCLRCKPNDEQFIGEREEIVVKALALLQKRNHSTSTHGGLTQLAKDVGVTPSYLCRVFKKTMGMTLGKYIEQFEDRSSASEDLASASPIEGAYMCTGMSQSTTPITNMTSNPKNNYPFQPYSDAQQTAGNGTGAIPFVPQPMRGGFLELHNGSRFGSDSVPSLSPQTNSVILPAGTNVSSNCAVGARSDSHQPDFDLSEPSKSTNGVNLQMGSRSTIPSDASESFKPGQPEPWAILDNDTWPWKGSYEIYDDQVNTQGVQDKEALLARALLNTS